MILGRWRSSVWLVIACALLGGSTLLRGAVDAAITPQASSQKVIFEDEFNGSQVDKTTWIVEQRAGNDQGTARAELQYYTPDAVTQTNGVLHITAERKRTADRRTGVTLDYISGRMQTRRTFLYGRFEFRAKLPRGRGLWPGLWLRTPPVQPLDGEIDVIEGYGSHLNIVQSTLHPWVNGKEPRQYCAWLIVQPEPDSPRFHRPDCERLDRSMSLPRDLASDFHVYVVEWFPDHITWELDGTSYFTVKERIPRKPMVIIVQNPLSAHWDGKPDKTTEFPQALDIDYVRVFAAKEPER
jgi:beta-glucanase (GH16 family)